MARIQLRRDTAANWTAANPTLASGEKGIETDTGKEKTGNGTTAWNALSYLTAAAGPHKASHEPGGSDALAVDAAAATGSLRTLGTSATSATAGNDARLSDARTPTAHRSTHGVGGSDALTAADLGTGTADAATFLRGDRTWAVAGGGADFNGTKRAGFFLIQGDDAGAGSCSTVIGFMRAMPVFVAEPTPIDQILLYVSTAGGAGALVRLGVYDDATGIPTNRLADFGTVAGDTTGVKAAAGTLTLPAGRSWLVGVGQVAQCTCRAPSQYSFVGVNRMRRAAFTAGSTTLGFYNTAGGITGALPATFGAATDADAIQVPLMWVRLA